MPTFNDIAVRLYRRLFGAPGQPQKQQAETVLDGSTAVALTEASICDSAALGGSFPASIQDYSWRHSVEQQVNNSFDHTPDTLQADGPRGALAGAMGQCMTGRRSTVFLSSSDLAAAQDLLNRASGQHLPLVVHVTNHALGAQGNSAGSGHQGFHLSSDSGCFSLFASSVQEAIDYSLIARRVAETALIPGLVIMDSEATALSAQDVSLPSADLARGYLGDPDDPMDAATPTQQMLFGETRPRVPHWFDLDRPLMQGTLQSSRDYALGVAANAPYFQAHLPELMAQAFDDFARHTGRRHKALSADHMDNAQIALVAQGSAIETARAVARHLRDTQKLKVGVLGINCLRPLPGARLVSALKGSRHVLVLECQSISVTEDPPLLRELRSAFGRALENRLYAADTHVGYPRLEPDKQPRLHPVSYGIGGLALAAADLVSLCTQVSSLGAQPVYLGIDFHSDSNRHPKRRVMLDRVRRAYPGINRLGLRERSKSAELRPGESLSLRILRPARGGAETLLADIGSLLHRITRSTLRTRTDLQWDDWDNWYSDILVYRGNDGEYPGDDLTADIAIATSADNLQRCPLHEQLVQGGTLLLPLTGQGPQLAADTLAAVQRLQLTVFALAKNEPPEQDALSVLHSRQYDRAHLLGGLFGVLLQTGKITANEKKILNAWEAHLQAQETAAGTDLLDAFQAGLDALQRLSFEQIECLDRPLALDAPMVVRQLDSGDERIDSLPRFWDQVGVLYRNNEQQDLTADPYMGCAVVPPLSATFRDFSYSRRFLPAFEPAACDACGACWRECPDSAIAVSALTPTVLMDTAISLTGSDALRPLAAKLAARIGVIGRSGDLKAAEARDLITMAWQWLQGKAALADDRLKTAQAAIEAVCNKLDGMPLAFTGTLFHDAEKVHKDGGELLFLSINPDSCKGCGLCITACPNDALDSRVQSREGNQQAKILWQLWEQIPDTPSATIERVVQNGSMEPLAGLMMSRYCAQAMGGGDGAEAGAGDKMALRLALAATEYQQQPLQLRFSHQLEEAAEQINQHIRNTLSDALPTDELEDLERRLQQTDAEQINLGALSRDDEQTIDASRLRRLVHLYQALRDTHWRLSSGRHKLGRARASLVVAGEQTGSWAGAFPNNPFQIPVALDFSGDGARLAAGLLRGQQAATENALHLLQQAQAELAGKAVPLRQDWHDLSPQEQQLCQPLILVGSESELAGQGLAQISSLLGSDQPIKILVLSDLDLGLDTSGFAAHSRARSQDPKGELALTALAHRSAYVAQCSLAAPAHYHRVLRQALRFSGPALIRVHAPSPERHGFASDRTLAQARRALEGRVMPLFSYHPQTEGVFGSRVSLQDNPAEKLPWVTDEQQQPLTPLDWAAGERRFKRHFVALDSDDPMPVPALQWLQLDAGQRQRQTPCYETGEGEQLTRYRVSLALMAAVEQRQHAWRTLQELAGEVTPFTEQVQLEAEQQVASEHAQQLSTLEQEKQAQLEQQKVQLQDDMARQIRDRLLGLTGYK